MGAAVVLAFSMLVGTAAAEASKPRSPMGVVTGAQRSPIGRVTDVTDIDRILEQQREQDAESTASNAAGPPPPCVTMSKRSNRCPAWVQSYTNQGGHTLDCGGLEYPQWSGVNQDTVFVTGFTCQPRAGGTWDFQTVAYDAATGGLKWVATYDGPAHVFEVPSGLSVSPNGAVVYVTGLRDWREEGTGDLVTIAYRAADGTRLWESSYAGTGQGTDWGLSVAASRDGTRVYVTGRTEESPAGPNDFVTISYVASTGQQDWVAVHQGPGPDDIPLSIGTKGSSVYVTGSTAPLGLGQRRLHTVGFFDDRASHQGTELWEATFTGVPTTGAFDNRPLTGYIGVGGPTVIVAGTTQNPFKQEWVTVAYDPASGAIRWVQRYGGSVGTGQAFALAASPDGGTAYVAGWAAESTSGSCGFVTCGIEAQTVAYDSASGRAWWVGRYTPIPGALASATGYALTVSPDGTGVHMAGWVDYPLLNATLALKADALMVAFDAATGRQRWASLYNDRPAQASPAGVLEIDQAYLAGTTTDGSMVFAAGSFIRQVPKGGNNFWDFGALGYDP